MSEQQVERYRRLVNRIKLLNLTETEELFKILHSQKCKYTVNNNGIFINMSWLSLKTIDDIEQFIEFCAKSSGVLAATESVRDQLNKDMIHLKTHPHIETETTGDIIADDMTESDRQEKPKDKVKQQSKITSSMRFYLLKKKFAKAYQASGLTNELKSEPYIITKN